MKPNIFVLCLLTLVKTLAVTLGGFLLLMLVFNDNLGIFQSGERIFLYVFFGIFFYSVGCIAYVFAILLPMYYIDSGKYDELSAPGLFSRHAPIVALIATFFCGMAALIAGPGGLAEASLQSNIFNVYVMAFSGLLFHEFQIKHALTKRVQLPAQATEPAGGGQNMYS
jgi:hypothetical protein